MSLAIKIPLLLGAAIGSAGLLALAVGTIGLPLIVGVVLLLVWWFVIGPIVAFVIRRRIIWRAYQVVGFIAMVICLPLAALGNRGFGVIVVGSIVILALFTTIGSIGEWRWRARDEHERRAVRTGRPLRFPIWWDLTVGAGLLASVVLAMIAVTLGSFGVDPGVAIIASLAFLLLGVLGGIQLDHYLNELVAVPALATAAKG